MGITQSTRCPSFATNGGAISSTRLSVTQQEAEKAVLVGIDRAGAEWSVDESLAELARLVQTDGATTVAMHTQRLSKPIPKTYIGTGKAQEVADDARARGADVIVFDEELSPSQQANLERIVGEDIKVIDRTALILDIFARHAQTREGRLQVQLAQNQYLLPRLRGMWSHLVREQTRGGIGSRFGQGESQLEVDRRMVRKRISSLQRELTLLERRRATQSKSRHEAGIYRVALVGYTNAGKSTLLNALTGSSVYVQDELFATLDPTTRAMDLAEGRRITLTDTVGFIQKLPTTLVEAFKSTLAEVQSAHLILLVVDAHDPHGDKQNQTVLDVLTELGAKDIPRVLVYNKCDLLSDLDRYDLMASSPDAEFVSALNRQGLQALTHRIAKEASAGEIALTVLIPFGEGKLMQMVHERCRVIREEYTADGLMATIRAGKHMQSALEPYRM